MTIAGYETALFERNVNISLRFFSVIKLLLIWQGIGHIVLGVGEPNIPPAVTPEQIRELHQKLSHMRHEINNQLALVVAALEMIRYQPELREKMMDTVAQQTPKITGEIAKFSAEFELTLGIRRE